jgi:hypothetical protein
MAAETTPEVDETAVARESPVRRAHAAAARRRGRSSAPGYLGVPLEELADQDPFALAREGRGLPALGGRGPGTDG